MDGGEAARFDYMEILEGEVEQEEDSGSGSGTSSISTGRIELEDNTLSGLTAETISGASGGQVVRTEFQGTASFTFDGDSGDYTINVSYYDENDGAASYKLTVGGTTVDEWTADEDKGNASPVSETKVTRTMTAHINKGDEVVLECTMDAGEPARADYIEIN